MKKKLLSLVLAGAMVASTSVSAFAAPNITGSDTDSPTTDVAITGKVLDNTGQEAPGTFSVTIPTAASFTVDQNGNLQGATIKVTNSGPQNIDVYADKFVDTQVNTGITVTQESQLKTVNKTNVSLNLEGNLKILYLKSEGDAKYAGLYTDKNLSTKADETTSKIATVKSGAEVDLTLSGRAGEHENDQVTNAINDKFTLTLKIKKSEK